MMRTNAGSADARGRVSPAAVRAAAAMAAGLALALPAFAKPADFTMRGGDAGFDVSSPALSFHPLAHGEGWRYTGQSAVRGCDRRSPPLAPGETYLFGLALTNGPVRFVEGRAVAKGRPDGGMDVSYAFTPRATGRMETISVQGALRDEAFRGGRFVADGVSRPLPGAAGASRRQVDLTARALRVESPDGTRFVDFAFPEPQRLSVLGPSRGVVCTLRFLAATRNVVSGETRRVSFALRIPQGLRDVNAPWTVAAGARFVPLRYNAEIRKGSILDFTDVVPRAPCGAYGRLRPRGAHFEFDRLPGVRQRFYGINLHSHACTNTLEEARLLVDRFVRMGYNAARFHNFENEWMGLTCGSADEATPVESRFVGIDNLVAAMRERGMYLTVDLHVGRCVSYRALGIDRPGKTAPGELKYLYLVNAKARENFRRLVKGFLEHVNPHTGRRYADEPTLMLLSLVNESPCSWRFAKPGENICALEDDFMREMRAFVRDEVKSDVPLANLNGGATYFCQAKTRAELFDYVDDHFYHDHPAWPSNATWRTGTRLPMYTSNRRPFAERERHVQSLWSRVWGKPYVVTEFNWCAPSLYRSWAGVVCGARAALQDWDGLWRYLWSHDHARSLNPGKHPIYKLEGASDPLAQAAERAAMCLFLRGDMKPLARSAAVVMEKDSVDLRDPGHRSIWLRDATWPWAGWHARLGTAVGTPPEGLTAQFRYPRVSPSDAEVEKALGIAGEAPGDGAVSIEYGRNAFSVDTPRTCGVAVESGRMSGGPLTVDAGDEITALWASAMDGRDVRTSGRILLTHLTQLYNTGDRFADVNGAYMLEVGRPPYLMPRAQAKVALALDRPEEVVVHAIDTDGTRRFTVPASVVDGRLAFTCDTAHDPSQATFLYELTRRREE